MRAGVNLYGLQVLDQRIEPGVFQNDVQVTVRVFLAELIGFCTWK
jgi:hypothetical protein